MNLKRHFYDIPTYSNLGYHNLRCTCRSYDKAKALDKLVGCIWLILTLLPILEQSHKGCVLQIAKVPLQTNFKHSEPFLAFLVKKNYLLEITIFALF